MAHQTQSTILDDFKTKLKAFSNDMITTLSFTNNSTLRYITNCALLSTLRINNSNIISIDNCPSLYNINIANANSIYNIKSASLSNLSIDNCKNLQLINCVSLYKICLSKTPNIREIVAPNVRSVKLCNIDISNIPFRLSDYFFMASTFKFKYCRIFNLFEEIYRCTHVQSLMLVNCNIESIDGLTNIKNISINSCGTLKMIYNIKNSECIKISNCSKLVKISQINNISSFEISQCGNLIHVNDIDCKNLMIKYCFALDSILSPFVKKLILDHCPKLDIIYINTKTTSLIVNECMRLRTIEFLPEEGDSYCNLKIKLIGYNEITSIVDWYVKWLLVESNMSLTTITNVNNLRKLEVINCHQLNTVSNIPTDVLTIINCSDLETIYGIYGLQELYISECEILETINIELSQIVSLHISYCSNLFFYLDGSELKSLHIEYGGNVIATDINDNAVIHIDDSDVYGGTYTTRDIQNVKHKMQIMQAAMITINNFIKNTIQILRLKKYILFKKHNKLDDCAICQEPILPYNICFTRCNHIFHRECICEWIKIRRSCPLCNGYI